jgi:gamma-glutamyltranspeptidase / glutathione hydrolase
VHFVRPSLPLDAPFNHRSIQMNLDQIANGSTTEQWVEISKALLETQVARTKFVDGAVLDGSVVTKLLEKDSHLGGTTHLSAIDCAGNAVSLTITNGEGSGVVLPKYGIMTNNFLGEKDLHPTGFGRHIAGTRLPSMMCPTLARHQDGTWAALGSGGSERIRSAVSQVVARMLGGATVFSAVCAPRLHWDGTQLHVECPLAAELAPEAYCSSAVGEQELEAAALRWRDTLQALCTHLGDSVPVKPWYRRAMFFGGVHVAFQCSGAGKCGLTSGQGDPRRSGSSA